MNIEVYEARLSTLLAALRSIEYKQGTHSLRNEIGYCCLGVACEISQLGDWHYDAAEFAYMVAGNSSIERLHLPREVKQFFGFHASDGFIQGEPATRADDGPISSLAGLNDSGWSFAAIADFIEARKADLFHWA